MRKINPKNFNHNLRCPSCNGKKSLSYYPVREPHVSCHKCKFTTFDPIKLKEILNIDIDNNNNGVNKNLMTKSYTAKFPIEGTIKALKERGLDKEDCEYFGVETIVKINSKTKELETVGTSFPYHNDEQEYVAQKIKSLNKDMTIRGNWSDINLFGQHLFPAGCNKFITITEGEEDTIAAHKMMRTDPKYLFPVVSVPNGAKSAKGFCQKKWEYLNSFETIVICFDNDEEGKAASIEVAELFPNKAKIMRMDKYKDANEYLIAGKKEEFRKLWWAAEKVTPMGVILSSKLLSDMLEENSAITVPYPWNGLQDKLYGMRTGELVVWKAPPKIGKCFGKGTKIRMWDGSVKVVEDIFADDLLMGDDGTPRKVISTITGWEELFEIKQNKRDTYVVNKSHIMCLKNSNSKKLIDIPLTEYFTLPDQVKWKGYAAPISKQEPIDLYGLTPYMLGIWLGDGDAKEPQITNVDKEIIQEIYSFAKNNSLEVSYHEPIRYWIKGKVFKSALKKLNQIGNKHIPKEFLTAPYSDRLELLAGLIDTDGYLNKTKGYSISQKSHVLALGICNLARSLGFRASCKSTKKYCTYKGNKVTGMYYIVHIYGQVELIPCRVKRKSLQGIKKQTLRDPLIAGIKVKSIGDGVYHGFVLDGNHRFLLEDCTVVHNTQIFRELAYHIKTTTEFNVGLIFLEETTKRIGMGLCSLHMKKNLQVPDAVFSVDELTKAYNELLADDRFLIFDPKAERTAENVFNKIMHFVKAYECKYVFLDHVSMLAYDNMENDERRFLDKLFKDLKDATVSLDIHISAITHVNDEGKSRGSRASYQLCDALISLERDKLNPDEFIANTMALIVEENRISGECGLACHLNFDRETSRFTEVDLDFIVEEKEKTLKKANLKFEE